MSSKLWALDAEWKPYTCYGKQGKMSLVQLGDDRTVYLFHVIHMKKFPEALARILQDSHIFKVGINIRNDATKMLKDWGVGCASLVELGALSIQVQDDLSSQRKIRSMESLTKELVSATDGTTVVTVRGSLQERLDNPATVEDIIIPVPKQIRTIPRATAAGGSAGAKRLPAATGYTKVSKAKVTGSSQATKRRTANTAAPVVSSTGMSGRSSEAPAKATTKNQLLPESLEGKDVLERNQSVWLEAGGRDLSEDGDVEAEAEEQDDWHLRQNQALFASLVTPNSDSDSESGFDADSDVDPAI
ncbi:hypothetical protein BGZ95_000223 [Linnemannia exigua]|uniref:3'-5' exonuclease n=1 Tax=Linnemannia exigua TaxID=604196 RepID=A0AAD4D935_9FUNG|nr:hypothetical protein BGZ95_000223 [Linnemannia exigua]